MAEYWQWYIQPWRTYVTFRGRAGRTEYWTFSIVNGVIALILLPIPHLLIVRFVFALATLLPGLAVSVRRLHDTGMSGWYIFVGLVPIVGDLLLLWFMLKASEKGDNLWGPNPNGEEREPDFTDTAPYHVWTPGQQ